MTLLLAGLATRGGGVLTPTGASALNTHAPLAIEKAPHVLTVTAVMGMYKAAPPTPAGATPPAQPPPPVTSYVGQYQHGLPGPKPSTPPALPGSAGQVGTNPQWPY